jgi:hypothetical protein
MLGLFIVYSLDCVPSFPGTCRPWKRIAGPAKEATKQPQALRKKQRSNPFRPAAMESLVMSTGLGEPHHTSINTVEIP